MMSNLRKFGTVAVVTLVAIGCDNDSNNSGPKHGPKAQMSVLGNEVTAIEIKVGARGVSSDTQTSSSGDLKIG